MKADNYTADPVFDIAFQPIVRACDSSVFGFEALARPNTGVNPAAFFNGLRGEERSIADYRCRQLALMWAQALQLPGRLCLNVLPSAICHPIYGLAETVRFARQVGFPLEYLVFEITEHEQIDDYRTVLAHLEASRREGVRFALDDFGSGFNGLITLMELRPDIVKFDKALVNIMEIDHDRQRSADLLLEACRSLGAELLAEGIETGHSFRALRSRGFQLMQGYYLGKPTSGRQARDSLELLLKPLSDRAAH